MHSTPHALLSGCPGGMCKQHQSSVLLHVSNAMSPCCLCAAAGAMRDEAYVEKASGIGGKVQRTFSGEHVGQVCVPQAQSRGSYPLTAVLLQLLLLGEAWCVVC